jgi:hypothetical protein
MGPRTPRGPPPHLIRPPTIRLNSSIPVTQISIPPNDSSKEHLIKESQHPDTHNLPRKVSKLSCEPAEDKENSAGPNRVRERPTLKQPLVKFWPVNRYLLWV